MVGELGTLEISYIALLAFMSAAAGLFSVYVILQQFRNPSRRRSKPER